MNQDIDKIIDNIYDPKIENPEYQSLMKVCIKAWIRQGIDEGIRIGQEELALEIDRTVKKYINPNKTVVII